MKLGRMLEQQGITCTRSHHRPTYTALGLADREQVPDVNVAKPVVVKGTGDFVMCVVPANRRLDLQRVAEALGELKVRLAAETELAELFPRCELGAEPPIGEMFGLCTIVDKYLHKDEYVVMQAGTHSDAVQIKRQDWERLCDPIVADISTTPPEPPAAGR